MTLVSDVFNIHTLLATMNIFNIYINGYTFSSLFFPSTFSLSSHILFQWTPTSATKYIDHSEESKPLNLPTADLIGNYREGQGRPGRRSLNCRVRFSGRHFIDWIPDIKPLKCAVCCGKSGNFAGSRVRTWCPDCGVRLCVGQCFRDFHTLVIYEEWWQ